MSLPDSVADFLQAEFRSQFRPYCFLVDKDYRLVEQWGDGAWCGLGQVGKGADMQEFAPFLVGMDLGAEQKLEFVQAPGSAVAHVYLVPEGDHCYAILLDASDEHGMLRQKQQSVNELRLLHAHQQKLIERQRELISELVETRSELDHLRREAERVSENKGRFIAMMSHEFRTPLASILNYSELALDAAAESNDVQKSIETITRSARHLNSLVEAILDDATLDAGQVQLVRQDFDIRGLLDNVAAMMAPLAAEKGLSFAVFVEPDLPSALHADDVRLRQVLINLLSNAVKFTIDGGVKLTATYNEGRLVVSVSDSGPGISVDDQERVFRAFERGDGQGAPGAGLGLTITLRLVELMGGEVSLDSLPGEGCTVSVHVPVAHAKGERREAADVLPTPSEDSIASKPLSILICDDDEDMVALVEHYLHRSGYGLIASANSAEAIEKALKFDPDLVLMDCNLPGVGGVVAARVLRERGYGKPIVALTASRLDDADKSAFSQCFRKPAPMQELLNEIKRLTH